MQFFINDLINTLTSRRKERVGDILRETTVSKDQVQIIAAKLDSMQDFAPLTLTTETPFGGISGTIIKQNMRDVSLRLAEMYRISDLVSLILDSENALLHSAIQALEQDLTALQKMADNYAFLLSDAGVYNFAYLEPFNDEIGRDRVLTTFPDRGSQTFSAIEQAVVSSDEGVLALTAGIGQTISAVGSILDANASGYLVSDTGVANALNLSSATGWVYTVRSPNPITSSLKNVQAKGVQVQLEFILSSPSPLSEIRLAPIASNAVQILQVTLFSAVTTQTTDASTTKVVNLLSDPMTLTGISVLRFPLTSVSKVQVVINQPTYNRNIQAVNIPEDTHTQVWNNTRSRKRDPSKTLFPTLHFVLQKHAPTLWKYIPSPNTEAKWGPLRNDRLIANINSFLIEGYDNAWTQEDPQSSNLLNQMNTLFPEWSSSIMSRTVHYAGQDTNSSSQYQWASSTQAITNQNPSSFIVSGGSSDYEYSLGLQSITFGVDTPNYKGVFISSPMAVTEQVSVVRLKTSEQNNTVTNLDWDSVFTTSVEYSVAAISNPINESDWIPILPVDQVQVVAERFFPGTNGAGFLRFPADSQEPIKLYKNHLLYSLTIPNDIIFSADRQTIIGLVLPTLSYTSQDIFTIDYTPSADPTVVNFNALGYDKLPLIASHDNDGAGQGFVATGERNIAVLSASPYIDYNQVSISTYADTVGLRPYQPVKIIFQDGTIPINLTNYIPGGTQAILPTSGYYYLHSDSTLIFNQSVTQPFRVYYQYLQNTVRVRVVLRVNDSTFVSPTVDFFHLKAMTRRSNALAA